MLIKQYIVYAWVGKLSQDSVWARAGRTSDRGSIPVRNE
jgi:hypothetical protein